MKRTRQEFTTLFEPNHSTLRTQVYRSVTKMRVNTITAMLRGPEDFSQITRLSIERWKERLDPNEHIDEPLRIIELELPGRFRLR